MGVSSSPTISRFEPHQWRTYRALRLRALANSPDAFGGTYQEESAQPDTEWARRLEVGGRAQTELPLVAWLDDVPIGLAWGRVQDVEPDVVRVFHVWVAPEHRGQGVGRALLDAILDWARELGLGSAALDVTSGDSPAMRLYGRAGFRPSGEPQPLRPGSSLTRQLMWLPLNRDVSAPSA